MRISTVRKRYRNNKINAEAHWCCEECPETREGDTIYVRNDTSFTTCKHAIEYGHPAVAVIKASEHVEQNPTHQVTIIVKAKSRRARTKTPMIPSIVVTP